MVPSTVAGVLVFVLLLTPGFVYQLRLERTLAIGRESALRELLRIIVASLICGSVALAAGGLLRAHWPSRTPDVGQLVRSAGRTEYFERHYRLVGGWVLLLLTVACGIAFVSADPRLRRVGRSLVARRPLRWLVESAPRDDINPDSAWDRLLHMYEDRPELILYAGCQLDDGSYISGVLFSLSPQREETADRDLVLVAPLLHRTEEGRTRELPGVGFAAVSARRIVRLDMSHLEPGTPLPQADPVQPEPASEAALSTRPHPPPAGRPTPSQRRIEPDDVAK